MEKIGFLRKSLIIKGIQLVFSAGAAVFFGRPPSLPLRLLAAARAGDLVNPPSRANAEAYFFISVLFMAAIVTHQAGFVNF
jgi:hypothetical protein